MKRFMRTKEEYEARKAFAKEALKKFKDADFGVTENWKQDYAMPSGVYNKPEREIVNAHPRVYLNADLLPKIRETLVDEDYVNMRNAFLAYADSEGFTGVFEERVHKSGETYRYDEKVLAQIESRALMYLLTGEECYGYEAIMGVKNAMLTWKYTMENHCDVYHGPGHVMYMLAEVYDWCYDLLTEQDKAQMISGCVYLLIDARHVTDDDFVLDENKIAQKKARYHNIGYGLEFNFPPNNYNCLTGHGPGPQFLRLYMMATMAFADEMPSWWEYVGGRFYQEYVPAGDVQFIGGNVSQGTSCYAPLRVLHNLEAAYLVKLATGENPLTDDMKKSGNFMLSHIMGNGLMFETGDGPRTGIGRIVIYCYFYFFAALYNDTFSLQAAKYYSHDFKNFQIDGFYTVGPTLALALASACDKPTGRYPYDMPLITYTGYPVGQTIIRDDWSESSTAIMMKINERTLAAHDLMDSGTFQIYHNGFLACTSGSYKLFGSPHHQSYLQSTIAMNGLLIYNPALADTQGGWYSGSQIRLNAPSTFEELNSGKYDISRVIGVQNAYDGDKAHYAYLAGDITKSYDEITVDGVERRMLAVYTGCEKAPTVFFVYDNIAAKDADFKKSFLLHTVKEPTVSTNSNGQLTATVIEGNGKLVLTNVTGGDNIYAIGGEGYAYWIGNNEEFDGTGKSGANLVDKNLKDDEYKTIWGRVEITARGEKTTKMLNTMVITDADKADVPDSVAIENDTLVGATVGCVTAVFVKNSEREKNTLSFNTGGNKDMKYYISGVAAGTWDIYVDGVKVDSVTATKEGGFLFFKASTGEIVLKLVTE